MCYRRPLYSFFLSLLVLAASSSTPPASANLISDTNLPPGINTGDSFRVIFVTSGKTDATSPNIADYDAFVQGFAPADLTTGWRAVGSTNEVDANVHTDTEPGTDGTGIPIFNILGDVLAHDNADLWDGSLENPVLYDELGVSAGTDEVWTGTGPNGVPFRSTGVGERFVLGDSQPVVGAAWRTATLWIDTGIESNDTVLRVYAISDAITAVPEPAAICMFEIASMLGIVAFSRYRRRSPE